MYHDCNSDSLFPGLGMRNKELSCCMPSKTFLGSCELNWRHTISDVWFGSGLHHALSVPTCKQQRQLVGHTTWLYKIPKFPRGFHNISSSLYSWTPDAHLIFLFSKFHCLSTRELSFVSWRSLGEVPAFGEHSKKTQRPSAGAPFGENPLGVNPLGDTPSGVRDSLLELLLSVLQTQ